MEPELAPSRVHTILICDDQAEMRGMLRAVIELIPGMRVVGEAADGEVAILEAARLQPDVILLDLAMPVMSGFTALPTLRRDAPAAKIIVFAGFSTATVADEVLALGADSYVQKGTDMDTLIALIEHVVAGTAPIGRLEGV
jgi:DNA-binding NarL/FixJ family response regulator